MYVYIYTVYLYIIHFVQQILFLILFTFLSCVLKSILHNLCMCYGDITFHAILYHILNVCYN